MTASLEIERKLTLSPQQCFALWADPDEVRKWWGPKDHTGAPFKAEIVEWKVQEGAAWAINMIAPDGTVYRQSGEMIEVDPPRRLRFSFHWVENGSRGPMTEITVRFDPDGTGTRMRFTQSGFADAEVRDSHAEGWHECLDRLDEAAARRETTAA
jgi:uncharacterized protein YndB with AHSA1/START domain